MNTRPAFVLLAIALGACARGGGDPTNETTVAIIRAPSRAAVLAEGVDIGVGVPTAESHEDAVTTTAIRNAVMADESLSDRALNMHIATSRGVITLRGPMKSAAEKKSVLAQVSELAGSNRVDDQLYVDSR